VKANKRQNKEKTMSDVEETEVQTNPIEDLVQSATNKDYTSASDIFNNIMGEKMAAALDQMKIGIASQIYNGEEPEPEVDDEFDVDEEDLEVEDEDAEVEEDEEEWPDNPLEGNLEDE